MRHSFDHYDNVELTASDLALDNVLHVARAAISVSLPPWRAGLSLDFFNDSSDTATVAASAGESIKWADASGATLSGPDGSKVRVTATNRRGAWVVEDATGEWSLS